MIPCKFFQRGYCRFGSSCRFYHGSVPDGVGSPPNPFGSTGSSLSSSKDQNMPVLLESIKKDMLEWSGTTLWELSAYGVGGKGCLPGFEEFSIEEVRFASLANNNLPPPEVIQSQQVNRGLRNQYMQTENPQIKAVMESAILGKPVGSVQPVQAQQNIFGSSTTSPLAGGSIFGGGGGTSSSFGGFGGLSQPQAQSQSTFGGFGGTGTTSGSTGSIFGGGGALGGGAGSIFGGSTGAFGAPSGNTGLFGTSQTVQQPPQQQSSIFGAPAQPLQPQNTFSFNPSQPSSGQTSIFGQSLQQQPLQQQQQPSAFSFNPLAPSNTSPMAPGGSVTAPSGSGDLSSIFRQPQPQPSSFGGFGVTQILITPGNEELVFSAEGDLTKEEMEAFSAPTFANIDCIPLKPPPKSLCI